MPCYTPPMTTEELNSYGQLSTGQLEAVLCGVLTAHGEGVFDKVDWKKAGVPRAIASKWWAKHQALDKKRK